MKHCLLTLSLALLSTATSVAQTTSASAITAQAGVNSYVVEGETSQTIYWKFTADKNYIAGISPLDGSYSTPTVGTEFTTNADTQKEQLVGMKNASIKYPKCGYPFKKGVTYYIANTGYQAATGFQLELTENDNIDGGVTADKPASIFSGQTTYLGDPYSTNYNGYSAYAVHKATEDGMLTITSGNYMNVSVNGTAYTSEYSDGSYSFGFGVKKGEDYNITFSNLYQPIIVTAQLSHPTQGSIEMPFEGKEGENTLPADHNKYYYTFTPQTTGFLTISSDHELPGGTVAIYNGKTASSPLATSEQGSFGVRTEVQYTGSTYYIAVDKVMGTDADETFTIAMEPYKAGEKEDNPIVIETLPSTLTLENAQGTYYYAVNVPAKSNKFITVKAEGDVDTYTTVSLYPNGNSWGGVNGNSFVEANVYNDYDTKYIIKWVANETAPLSFTVAYKDIEKGDAITDPIEAVAGENAIASDGTKYYRYTATRSGKLAIDLSSPEMSVTFPRGTGTYDGTYDAIINGLTYSLEAEEGTSYLITVNNAIKGESFTLTESDFQQGEVRENPIAVEGNEFTVGNKQNNCWIKYTASADCQLTIDCDAPYLDNGANMVYYGNANESMSGMVSTKQDGSSYSSYFHGTKIVKAGDEVLVHLQLTGNVEGYKVTFAEGDLPEGASPATAYNLAVGETLNLPSYNTVWVKVNVKKGDNVFVANSSVRTIIYNSLDDAQNESNGEYVSYDISYDENYNTIATLKKTVNADTTIYLQITGSYSDYTFKYESNGTADGINAIEGHSDNATGVFTLNGVKVADSTRGLKRGIYIVRLNGKAKKMVINK